MSIASASDTSLASRMQKLTEERKAAAQKIQTVQIAGQTQRKRCVQVDETRLMEAWNAFADSLPTSEIHLKSLILGRTPRVDGDAIVVDIVNQAQKVVCESDNLISYLRTKLGNPYLRIVANLTQETASEASPYTSKQKLDVMIQNNSVLQKLISTFDLIFD